MEENYFYVKRHLQAFLITRKTPSNDIYENILSNLANHLFLIYESCEEIKFNRI